MGTQYYRRGSSPEAQCASRRRGGSTKGQPTRTLDRNRLPCVIHPQLPVGDPPLLVGFPPTLFLFQPSLVGGLSLLRRLGLPGPTRLPLQEFLGSHRAITNAVVVVTAMETRLARFSRVPELWSAKGFWQWAGFLLEFFADSAFPRPHFPQITKYSSD